MTAYIAWLGLPSVLVTAVWCAFACRRVAQADLAARTRAARRHLLLRHAHGRLLRLYLPQLRARWAR